MIEFKFLGIYNVYCSEDIVSCMKSDAILILLNTLMSGGAEKQAIWIACRLAQAGRRVWIYELKATQISNRLDGLLEEAAGLGVCVIRGNRSYASGVCRLLGLVNGKRFALVWSWGFRADSAAFLVRVMFAGDWAWWTSLRCADWRDLCKKRLPHSLYYLWADKAVSNTLSNMLMLREMLHTPLRVDVLHNVVAVPESHVALPLNRPEKLSIAMLGNIKVFHKGYDIVLDVVGMLEKAKVPVVLHIAGREDDGGWLRRSLAARNLGDWCVLYGESSRPEQFLRQHHAYLLCSRFEGMPNSLLEAMALGLPCVCSGVSDIGLIFGDGQAKLFFPVNADECFYAILWLVEHWDEARKLADSGRAFCGATFSKESVSGALLRLLASSCGDDVQSI